MSWTVTAEQPILPHTGGIYRLMADGRDRLFDLTELEKAKAEFHQWAREEENVLLQWEVIGDDGAVDDTQVILKKGEFSA